MSTSTLATDAARIAYELAMSTENDQQVIIRSHEMSDPAAATRLALAGRAAAESHSGGVGRQTLEIHASCDQFGISVDLEPANFPEFGLVTVVVTLNASSPIPETVMRMATHDIARLINDLEDDADQSFASVSDFVFIIDNED